MNEVELCEWYINQNHNDVLSHAAFKADHLKF